MRIKNTHFDSEAKAEYYKSAKYYKEIDKELSEDFFEEVEDALQQITEFPESGHPYLHQTRRVFLDRFPYAIVYRYFDQSIIVFAVHHLKRKPGYWEKRIK